MVNPGGTGSPGPAHLRQARRLCRRGRLSSCRRRRPCRRQTINVVFFMIMSIPENYAFSVTISEKSAIVENSVRRFCNNVSRLVRTRASSAFTSTLSKNWSTAGRNAPIRASSRLARRPPHLRVQIPLRSRLQQLLAISRAIARKLRLLQNVLDPLEARRQRLEILASAAAPAPSAAALPHPPASPTPPPAPHSLRRT